MRRDGWGVAGGAAGAGGTVGPLSCTVASGADISCNHMRIMQAVFDEITVRASKIYDSKGQRYAPRGGRLRLQVGPARSEPEI